MIMYWNMLLTTLPLQLKQGKVTRDQLVAHAFLLLVAGNATGGHTVCLQAEQVASYCPHLTCPGVSLNSVMCQL
jgi:hypothetical protein